MVDNSEQGSVVDASISPASVFTLQPRPLSTKEAFFLIDYSIKLELLFRDFSTYAKTQTLYIR
jgi:hypothetical protein